MPLIADVGHDPILALIGIGYGCAIKTVVEHVTVVKNVFFVRLVVVVRSVIIANNITRFAGRFIVRLNLKVRKSSLSNDMVLLIQ